MKFKYSDLMELVQSSLPTLVAITAMSILVYGAVQQDIRHSANDPQIQMSEDAAAKLKAGVLPLSVVNSPPVDVASSLAPFMIVFNETDQVVASGANLNGKTPSLPDGTLNDVKKVSRDDVTWQPQPGVRLAAVIIHFDGANPGFVLVARSMREVEIREDRILSDVLAGWGATCVAIILTVLLTRFIRLKSPNS